MAVCAQVEERLRFYEEGVAPRKNASVMEEAMASVKTQLADEDKADGGKKKKKVREEGALHGVHGGEWGGAAGCAAAAGALRCLGLCPAPFDFPFRSRAAVCRSLYDRVRRSVS